MSISVQNILDTLTHVRYPGTDKNIVSSGMVGDVSVEGNKVSFSLTFQKANDPFFKSVVKAAEQAIITYLGEDIDVRGNIAVKFKELPQVSKDESLLPEHFLAILLEYLEFKSMVFTINSKIGRAHV